MTIVFYCSWKLKFSKKFKWKQNALLLTFKPLLYSNLIFSDHSIQIKMKKVLFLILNFFHSLLSVDAQTASNGQQVSKISKDIVFVSRREQGAPKSNDKDSRGKRPLWEQTNMFGTRIKIMWEEQLNSCHFAAMFYLFV